MSKPFVKIVNSLTGEEIEREMTDEEFAQYELDAQKAQIEKLEIAAKAQAKIELLNKLGITEEEAKILLS